MVLEILVNPKKVSGKPWEMFFIGAVYSLVGVGLSFWIFKSYISLIMVALIAIASVPFIHQAILLEEQKEKKFKRFRLFEEHGRTISMFTFLFLGFVAMFVLLFIFLPQNVVEGVFKTQIDTIITINSSPTGNFFSELSSVGHIILNNLKILFFCLIFSFFYGVGAIFILSWNASVMATAIGSALRQGPTIHNISLHLTSYLLHGVPEIVSYFIVGLAGGIFSVAVVKEKIHSPQFKKIAFDCLGLVGVSIGLLIISALLEVFISARLLN